MAIELSAASINQIIKSDQLSDPRSSLSCTSPLVHPLSSLLAGGPPLTQTLLQQQVYYTNLDYTSFSTPRNA